VEVEFHPAGVTIFPKGAEALEFLRVIRPGPSRWWTTGGCST